MPPRSAALALLALLAASTSFAGSVELVSDNDTDFYVPGAGTWDRNYTQGARLAWYGEPDALPASVEGLARRLPGFGRFDRRGGERMRRFGVLAGQEIYTPDAISRTRRVTNDRPYAGWLHAGGFVTAQDEHRFRSLQVSAGMVGPASGAQEVQSWWHSRLGIRVPRGWQWQLRNEPGVLVRWEERVRPWGRRRHADVVPHAALTTGNVRTEAAAGATVRLGLPLPDDFGPSAVTPLDARGGPGASAYVYARAEGRAVAHEVFLDGNTFGGGPSVTRVPWVGEAQLGAGARWGRVGVRYAFSYTTQRFRERADAQEYGSIGISF
jgi:hypothetical protein